MKQVFVLLILVSCDSNGEVASLNLRCSLRFLSIQEFETEHYFHHHLQHRISIRKTCFVMSKILTNITFYKSCFHFITYLSIAAQRSTIRKDFVMLQLNLIAHWPKT